MRDLVTNGAIDRETTAKAGQTPDNESAIAFFNGKGHTPEYDTYDPLDAGKSGYTIKVVRDFEDMAKVFAIRGSACFSDPEHLYAKHFDGNDFSSTHLLGFIDGEPVGTIRIRYFSDFTRIERLTVRPTHRKSRISFKLAKAAFAWCRDKGYTTVGGVARSELIPFWTMLGFRLTEGKDPIYIYGLPHFDITLKLEPEEGAIKHMTDTMVLLRSEGRWHEAGHHEKINVTAPTEVAAPPPMVRRARRPADVAARLAERRDRGPAALIAPEAPASRDAAKATREVHTPH
ncbi:MAG: GNAT family N-acetyltransferase [Methylocystis sp.]|nr:GNAT family N-acetyltransferase [Methylocystis sp.]MCA3584913.1 GNAT family N-acetyltransferase [Methylocystis sp.]MCA3589484.1 GNAT family N-acetyltransferase [Methylocystis sp.]MCA3591131.1 GNAT family N-acetyltransferase [Methylocystis sp.]